LSPKCCPKTPRGREHACVEPLRVTPVRRGVEDQVRQQVRRDVVEHQRRDDLVRLEEGPQDPRDQPPQGAARAAGRDHPRDRDRGRPALPAEIERRCGGGDCADVELALGADVEQTHAKGSGCGEAGERERSRGDQCLAERTAVQKRSVEDQPVARERVVSRGEQNDSGGEECKHE